MENNELWAKIQWNLEKKDISQGPTDVTDH